MAALHSAGPKEHVFLKAMINGIICVQRVKILFLKNKLEKVSTRPWWLVQTRTIFCTQVFFSLGSILVAQSPGKHLIFILLKKKVKGLLSTETLCYLLLKAADAARSLKIKVYEKIVSIFQSLENHPAFCFLKLKIIPV